MKSPWKKPLVLLLLFALVVLGSLCFVLSGKQSCPHPFPAWLEVSDEKVLECPEHVQLKYTGCDFDPSSPEGEKATLRIECTLTKRMPEMTNYFILYQREEDSRWHVVFYTGYPVKLACFYDSPGTKTLECVVPRRVFSHKGVYKIGIADRGNCDLPREKLWNGPDEECGQLEGIHSESGFPIESNFKLAGPPDASPGTELTAMELVKGEKTDALKLTVNVEGNKSYSIFDNGGFHIYFCPPEEEILRLVYYPAESIFYEHSEPPSYGYNKNKIVPGLNTVEYPVPKGLFQQEGDYYISCGAGSFKLFENEVDAGHALFGANW